MNFVNLLKGIYYSAEDKWYNFLDALDRKQLPVYKKLSEKKIRDKSNLVFIGKYIYYIPGKISVSAYTSKSQ